MAGGRGRGRGRGRGAAAVPAPADALPSGGPSASASTPSTAATGRRACEVCEAAPGIPFCKVEWSFLCSSCGPNLHRDSWIVAVPPFPPTPPIPPNTASTGTDASSQVSPYFFPPFMQMPPNPIHLPPMPMPMHPPNANINASASAAGVKRKRRRARFTSAASKEQTPPSATDPNPNPNPNPDPPLPARTSADAGNAYADLHQGTTVANAPRSAEDGGAQLDTMESIAARMEPPPPPELDEIEAQREQ